MSSKARVLQDYYQTRQRARTDLLFLANEILGYKDINRDEHGPILGALQQFPGGEELFDAAGEWKGYRPFRDVWELEGKRNNLIIYPRGTYKTSLCSITHTIQWIVNYPDVRGLLSMATGTQVVKTMTALLGHFRFNDKFRYYFPEFCPNARNAKDWGSNEGFTVPCRKAKWLREQTLATCSIGKVMSGDHVEFLKHADVVDSENVRTPFQVQGTKDHFGLCNFLLHRGGNPVKPGWQDTEGTFYDFSDYYMDAIDKHSEDPDWNIIVRPPYKKDGSLAFPKTLPQQAMDIIKKQPGMTDYIYSCQILLKPVAQGMGLCSKEDLQKLFVPRKFIGAILPMLRLHATVDLAGMEQGNTGDFTVLNVCGFDRDGRVYGVDLWHSRFTPDDVIDLIFLIYDRYPRIIDIKIEKDAHARVLAAFLRREMTKRQKFPPVVAIPRDNRISKKHRIRGLQPWFKNGTIRFADDLVPKMELIHEVTRFSDVSTYHDDILDTYADQMQNQDGEVAGDVVPDAPKWDGKPYERQVIPKFLGFGPHGEPQWAGQEEGGYCYDSHTGL